MPVDAGAPTPCTACGSFIGVIPDSPPEVLSDGSLQLESTARGIVSEAEQRIADLEEMKRRSLQHHQSILRRLEEYRHFVSYQKCLMSPIRRVPSELLSEIFVTCVEDSFDFERYFEITDQPWVLGKVCRLWRDIVLTTPRLWNRLPRICVQFEFNDTDPSLVETCFKLARGEPLSIDIYLHELCAELTPTLNTLISHSDRIGELKLVCRSDAFYLLSGIHTRLHKLRTLNLNIMDDGDTVTAIFSTAPQLRDVFFEPLSPLHGNQFSNLDLPWSQLKTVTIHMPDLDYAWMVFSQALHMEQCTFIEIAHIGKPRGIIQHMGLKELSLEGPTGGEYNAFPTALFDILVLPNLINLLVKFDKLTISPIVSLVARSGCRLTKLVLNGPIIEGSLMMLLEETASLIHLEVHTLLPVDIKGLTVDKENGKQPTTPYLREIHITNSDDITDPSSVNTLICSRIDPDIPHLEPIQSIHFHFELPSRAYQTYGQMRGLPWMPEYTGVENSSAVRWGEVLRNLIARLPPKTKDISALNGILGEIEHWETVKQPFLATSEIYESLVYISSLDENSVGLLNRWSQLQGRIRLLLDSWTPLKEEYGKFPQSHWKQKMPTWLDRSCFISYNHIARLRAQSQLQPIFRHDDLVSSSES